MIAKTAITIQEWREKFPVFVADFFNGSTERYLARECPDPVTPLRGDWHNDIPVRDPRNWHTTVGNGRIRESRSWTWEIRLHQPIPVAKKEQLAFAVASPATADAFIKYVNDLSNTPKARNRSFQDRSKLGKQALIDATHVRDLLQKARQAVTTEWYESIVNTEKRIAELTRRD